MRAPASWATVALVAVAIAGPMLQWYFAGEQESDRRASRIQAQARQRIAELESRLGARVDARLDALRESESRRPWYHYQQLFHDPRVVPETISLAPSPLSEAPGDPLVRGHFQVDAQGRVSSPGALPRGLEPLGSALLALAPGGPFEPSRLTQLAAVQNMMAQRIVENARVPGRAPLEGVEVRGLEGHVDFAVTPLRWTRLEVAGVAEVVALRTVETPDGRLVQGFVVDRPALDAWTADSLYARLEPYAPPIHATLSLVGGTWRVRIEAAPHLRDADARAAEIREGFRHGFAMRASVALLAGLGALALVLQADRLARRRADFAAAAAHELRTPLASLRLHAEMIAEDLGDQAKTRDYARSIVEESRRLGRLVDNVLGYTRMERGSPAAFPRDGALVPVVREVVERQRLVLERAGLEVLLEADDLDVRARFDPEALAEILGNLLDNAEKHSRGSAAARRALVNVTRDPAVVVTDSGPGVPARRRRAIFRPFGREWRLQGGPSGLGLGLSLARSLARAQGGDLALEDSPGGGARFRVTLAKASSLEETSPLEEATPRAEAPTLAGGDASSLRRVVGRRIAAIEQGPWEPFEGTELPGIVGKTWHHCDVFVTLDDGAVVRLNPGATAMLPKLPRSARRLDDHFADAQRCVGKTVVDLVEDDPGGDVHLVLKGGEYLETTLLPGGTAVRAGAFSSWEPDERERECRSLVTGETVSFRMFGG